MKTYYFTICAIFVLLFFGCSKSDNGSDDGDNNTSIDANYVSLLSKDGMLRPQLLNANAEAITLNPVESSLAEKSVPDLSFVNGSDFLQYHRDGNCSGQITKHHFKDDTTIDITVFTDLDDCELTATAIAEFDDSIFISYEITSSNPKGYFMRIIDANTTEKSFVDVTLEAKPTDLTIANNRLFILTIDEVITDENNLFVMDMSNNSIIHEMALGYNAHRIFTDTHDNVIISYDELHTTLNSSTMAFEYTQYESRTTAPKFASSTSSNFDLEGRLFYPMEPGTNSSYALVPAIYDFSSKLVVLYAYENFLAEAKRNFEYEIETTTAVGYDEKNGLMLVGYKKMNGAAKGGGLLRIKLAPEPAMIDNIDLDGVPTEILIN